MKRSAKVFSPPLPGSRAIVYTMGKPKKVELILPVMTPEEQLRSVKLTPTARKRVERAIAEVGIRLKPR
jgi:hypothetical protein